MKKKIENYFDRLFPLNRSITGKDYRKSIDILSEIMPMKKINFKTGEKIFDWTIPKEWNVNSATLKDDKNKTIVDFKNNNLHLVGYSKKIKKEFTYQELIKNIHYIKKLPDAIQYVVSYYKSRWGFSMSYNQYKKLDKKIIYKVDIDTTHTNGVLTVGENILKGKSNKEIMISSYLCHPSMANNELSGPLTLVFLYNEIKKYKFNHSIRFTLQPETIGSIAYLSRYSKSLKKNCIGGYQITCCGLDSDPVYKKSKSINNLVDIAMSMALKNDKHKMLQFFPFGSDERQFNSPGIDIPFGSFMRTNYESYKEYHTSMDNKKIMNFKNFIKNIEILKKAIFVIDKAKFYKRIIPNCEPFLSKRNLYSSLSKYNHYSKVDKLIEAIFWILSYSDGKTSDLEIQNISKIDFKYLNKAFKILVLKKLIKQI
jgi:aminopeptidase-like protein